MDKQIEAGEMPRKSRSQSDSRFGEGSRSSLKLKSAFDTQEIPSSSAQKDPLASDAPVGPPPLQGTSSKAREGMPPGSSLASIFRYYMGIESDTILVPKHLAQKKAIDPIATGMHHGRRAVNLGIYNRAIREERGTALSFKIWGIVINAALGLQIIFAAILTALGAGGGPSDAVAIFGTLNTIIAGFLTYLKGTGLPMRMKYYHNQWLKLRAYIEQRERDFAMDDHQGIHRLGYTELMEEVQVIEAMYQNIRKDIEKHTPDNFGGNKADSDGQAPGEGAPQSVLASKGLNAFRARLTGAVGHAKVDVEHGFKGAIEDIERRIKGHLSDHLAKVDERVQSKSYGAMSQTRGSREGIDTDEESNHEAADSEVHGVSEAALARMHQTQTRALEAQYQAESRVKELEQKLAALDEVVRGKGSQDKKDQQS